MQVEVVLVTGGAGYIGSHAVLALNEAGFKSIVIDDLSTGNRWAVPSDTIFYEGDVGDNVLLRRIIDEQNPTAIMHFAGSVVVPESVANPLKYYHNNTANSRDLLQVAVNAGVKHFVFSSTAAVYGVQTPSPVSEDASPSPINPYGVSKLMTEQMLQDVSAVHSLNHCILRYFNVAGADPEGRTGQSTIGATNLVKVAVEVATGKREKLDVFGNDYETVDGTGVRDYIHVSDLAAAHVEALRYLVARPSQSLTLNCGYGRGHSVMEVIAAVSRVADRTVPYAVADRRSGDPGDVVADNRKIMEMLNWRPLHDNLDQIVGDALRWELRLGAMKDGTSFIGNH